MALVEIKLERRRSVRRDCRLRYIPLVTIVILIARKNRIAVYNLNRISGFSSTHFFCIRNLVPCICIVTNQRVWRVSVCQPLRIKRRILCQCQSIARLVSNAFPIFIRIPSAKGIACTLQGILPRNSNLCTFVILTAIRCLSRRKSAVKFTNRNVRNIIKGCHLRRRVFIFRIGGTHHTVHMPLGLVLDYIPFHILVSFPVIILVVLTPKPIAGSVVIRFIPYAQLLICLRRQFRSDRSFVFIINRVQIYFCLD